MTAILSGKKVAMIIASNGYRDEEFEEPRKILSSNGAQITVASSSLKEAKGTLGGKVKPDTLINDIRTEDFDCIIFVGGAGSSEYWNSPVAHEIAKSAYTSGKIISAICIAPVTLANAGILNGKKATVFPSEVGRLRNRGATCTGRGVEVDGNIITADGPSSAKNFANTIVNKLSSK